MPSLARSPNLNTAFVNILSRARTRALERYQRDPLAFCSDILGLKPESLHWGLILPPGHNWDGTPDPLAHALTSLASGKDVGIESGTGIGKSVMGAAAMCWFLASWERARVFTLAAKEDQLRSFIWMELGRQGMIRRLQHHFPDLVLTDLRLRMHQSAPDDGWGATGWSVGVRAGEEVSAKAAGMHAEHMLIIYEETQGIHGSVIEAGFNTATAPHNLRLFLGNPDHQLDSLHQACTSPGVEHIIASALDHPNVVLGEAIVPGAVSREKVNIRLAKYGEAHRLYQSRVRGRSPSEAADALIKPQWIKAAVQRYQEHAKMGTLEKWGKPALGIDVANSLTGDLAAIAYGVGRVLLRVDAKPCPNANHLGAEAEKLMRRLGIADSNVGVDTVGVGAGCYNELVRLKRYVRSLNGGAHPEWEYESEEEYVNLRAQMWWRAAEDLRTGQVDLPDDPELHQDLMTPTWRTRNGKILVESKEDIKKRLPSGRSPNKGDAFVYWNTVRDRAALAEPLKSTPLIQYGDPDIFRSPQDWLGGALSNDGDGW